MKTKYRFWQLALRLAMYTSLVGTMGVVGCLSKVGRNVNPCGTILNCNPAEWDWMMHNGDYPNYDVDPTCVIPGQCGSTWPPTTTGGIGGGTTTTGGTTTGGTTTGGTTTGGTTTGGGVYGGGYGGTGYSGGYSGGYGGGYGY